jgi:glycosyltransferase involved in cell wall biosynthesis
VLAGYALQDDPDFEVVVADDGSGSATATVIAAAARRSSPWRGLRHVWHPDQGFCKNEIPDYAICASVGDYLLLSDGDCISCPDFVSTHRGLATKERFLSGGYVRRYSSLVSGPRAWGRGRRLAL